MRTKLRQLDQQIQNHFQKYRQILVLLGARQVGKTTLLKRLFPHAHYLLLDNEPIRSNLERYDINVYKQLLPSGTKWVIVDEIHLLSNPGRAAKILFDQMPEINLIITGSSSLHIKNKTAESLAGRKIDYFLYPLTFSEYLYQTGVIDSSNLAILENLIKPPVTHEKAYPFDITAMLENILCFGLYPNLLNNPQDQSYLSNLIDSVIFKDIISLNLIENKNTALNLLRLLAFQIGNLVNYAEIGQRLSIDARTVRRYIEIFEQSFIIFRLFPFSNNKRDEIGKSPKIYFYDVGLRNALINNFSSVQVRDDTGALFENFIIAEVLKLNSYGNAGYQLHYWRTKQGAETDVVLSKENQLIGAEIKYRDGRISKAFTHRYPHAKTMVINSNNFY